MTVKKTRIIRLLIIMGIIIVVVSFIFKKQLLWIAVDYGNPYLFKFMSLGGIHPDMQDENGDTLLIAAAYWGHNQIVKDLINAGADINYHGSFDNTALIMAIQGGNLDTVAVLIEAGANINETSTVRGSPLLLATIKGETEIVETLIKNGANVNATAFDNSTVLMSAVRSRHADIVEMLINAGADVNIKNRDGMTAIMMALQNNDKEIARILTDQEAKQSGYDPRLWQELFDEKESIGDYEPTNVSTIYGLTVKEYRIGPSNVIIPKIMYDRRAKLRSVPFEKSDLINGEKIDIEYIEGSRVPLEGAPNHTKEKWSVKIGDKGTHVLEIVSKRWAEDDPLIAFYAYEGHWILEYRDVEREKFANGRQAGNVIVDWVDIGDKTGYREVFNYTFINKKPFYFFVDSTGATRMSYDDSIPPYRYDLVYHYECCGRAGDNPESYRNLVSFFAERADSLYYVEAGIYE